MMRPPWRRLGPVLAGALLSVALAGSAAAEYDPGTYGPHPVAVTQYGSFDTSVSLGQIATIEVLAQVHHPTDLANGPYPLVILLHGRHATCYFLSSGSGAYIWPCNPSTQAPIPSYQGYDYLASLLASHGMIVASISANGINAYDIRDSSTNGMDERARLIQLHLDKWNAFNTVGGAPFGTMFVGHVDMQRVGTMGHSRGGEGVVWNFERNASLGSPYGIRAVLPLAPTDNYGHFINNVPVGVLLGYCDGDVYSLPGVAFADDARYNMPADKTAKHTFLVLGANHEYFNRIWTPDQYMFSAFDDWQDADFPQTDPFCGTSAPGNGRLTSAQQRGAGAAYMTAFFRKYLKGVIDFDAYLTGDAPPPPSAQTAAVYSAYLPGAGESISLNRLLVSSELTVDTLGAPVTQSALTTFGLCGDWTDLACVSGGRDPHFPSLSVVDLGWSSVGATYSNQLPAGMRDMRDYGFIQFRVAVDYNDSRNPAGLPRDFSVRIVSPAATASVAVGDYARTLYFPPGYQPADVMNTVRIPLSAFTGVDKTNILSVDFVFDRVSTGDILVSDISFSRRIATAADVWATANSALF